MTDDAAAIRDDFEKVLADFEVALLIGWEPEDVQRARQEQDRTAAHVVSLVEHPDRFNRYRPVCRCGWAWRIGRFEAICRAGTAGERHVEVKSRKNP